MAYGASGGSSNSGAVVTFANIVNRAPSPTEHEFVVYFAGIRFKPNASVRVGWFRYHPDGTPFQELQLMITEWDVIPIPETPKWQVEKSPSNPNGTTTLQGWWCFPDVFLQTPAEKINWDAILQWFRDRCRDMANHEIDEWIKVRGERPFNPHKPPPPEPEARERRRRLRRKAAHAS